MVSNGEKDMNDTKEASENVKEPATPEPKSPATAGKQEGGGGGLSELARQLRVLQAKNQNLTIEIGRLERQLRIVAELSGVSVPDLRATLQRACESEAYGELQHRLASLQTQLEEAKLKQRKKAAEFDREAEGKKMANLQLRIGELEEAEGALRQEIGQLYKSQDEQAEETTKLKAANDQKIDEISRLTDLLQTLQSKNEALEKEAKAQVETAVPKRKVKDPPAHQSNKHAPTKKVVVAATAANKKDPQAKPKSPKPKSPKPAAKAPPATSKAPPPPYPPLTDDKAPPVTAKAAPIKVDTPKVEDVESKHVQLLRNQVESREKELELKESQYRARFALQEERIVDMEQQLSSLYTAFDLLNQEQSQEQRSKEELTRALRMADSQVAKAVDHLQRNTSTTANPQQQTTEATSPAPGYKTASVSSSPAMSASYSTPVASPALSSRSSSAAPQQINVSGQKDEVMESGYVMKRGRLNRWKKQYATLSRCFANFQLRLSDAPLPEGSRKKASFFFLTVFRSSFEAIKKNSNYPYAFRIKVDQYDKNSVELVLAVKTEDEYNKWIVSLHEAVNGTDAPGSPNPRSLSPVGDPVVVTPTSRVAGSQRQTLDSWAHDSDLEAALAESLQMSQQEPSKPHADDLASGRAVEESKEEIGDMSQRSDAELQAALAESLLVSQKANEVHG